ncbi:arsinothricin resistance N-acetyltransferase ArsN1 family B [Chitinimonas sp. BJB300]|uniref:arsinothricin resistance N-acetyltransferase ArsN1 family B n=1 Tax=Chitinimonas sp. BJB300 TaxID=1559339 RepID=UPI000C0FD1DB|nr:arsinothricin resistance N-acetyltransferase ArsN1 family B [Chitinimonas sp. BJB300]PHV12548.1 phosphinothricin acetyltransferase [Chitinimonas sp. BJB300]TSJ90056.1 N-acetyltransferase [Chitinimonas sp. BJB300]
MSPTLRDATADDAAAIAAIYNPYVLETVISFEESPIQPVDIARGITKIKSDGLPWLVAEHDGQKLGYAYASPWRSRPAYRHSVESSVYLAPQAQRLGIGERLYLALIEQLRKVGKHTVIGGIALPNAASVALHEKLGFRQMALFEQTGYKFGRWIDTGYWQLLL